MSNFDGQVEFSGNLIALLCCWISSRIGNVLVAIRGSGYSDRSLSPFDLTSMHAPGPTEPAISADEAIDLLLAAVDECGRTGGDPETYYRTVAEEILRTGIYSALTIWSVVDECATCRLTTLTAGVTPPPLDLLERALLNHAVDVPSSTESSNGNLAGHSVRVLAGDRIAQGEGLLLDVQLKPSGSDRSRRLLEALAELMGHAEARFRYHAVRQESSALASADTVIQRFHSGESLVESALLVAEGLQDQLGFDRCWVCVPHRGSARVIATSATSDVARRELLVKRVEVAANGSLKTGIDIDWSAGDAEARTTPGTRQLADEGAARRIRIVPLCAEGDSTRPIAAIVLEKFTGVVRPGEAERLRVLRPHATQAIAQALESDARGLAGALRKLDGTAWGRTGVIAAGAFALAVFFVWPVRFEIEAEGRLNPTVVRSIFAPDDGVVSKIEARHGDAVEVGSTLLTLRSPQLDLELERLLGQISELKAKLASLQVLRAQGKRNPNESASDLSAQEEQLNVALAGADKQLVLIRQQIDGLRLASPIAGVVDRWDLQEALAARPVTRGQHLFDILDTSGAWRLELRIPDKLAGFPLAARANNAALPVRFVLRTDPHAEHTTTLGSLGERTELDEHGKLTLAALADVPADDTLPRRPGASVTAKIDCGRCTRAYAWFHGAWNELRRHWF